MLNMASASAFYQSSENVTETFTIASQYCTPSDSQPKTVQVLTHGVGFDRKYWSWGGHASPYNYVRVATDAGYATLAWDRLGCGQSSKPDPYAMVQAQIEVAVLIGFTEKLRDGSLHESVPEPKTVVHVGHSFVSGHRSNVT
jgi:pimeloyl-ACP methyl ester carboxylesterase